MLVKQNIRYVTAEHSVKLLLGANNNFLTQGLKGGNSFHSVLCKHTYSPEFSAVWY